MRVIWLNFLQCQQDWQVFPEQHSNNNITNGWLLQTFMYRKTSHVAGNRSVIITNVFTSRDEPEQNNLMKSHDCCRSRNHRQAEKDKQSVRTVLTTRRRLGGLCDNTAGLSRLLSLLQLALVDRPSRCLQFPRDRERVSNSEIYMHS